MKVIVMLSLFATALAYTDLDDTISFDNIIANKAEFKNDIDCAIGRKTCKPELQKYKNHLGDAVFNACKDCTDIEKHDLAVLIKALKAYPEEYKVFQSMFDLDGTRIPAVEEKLKDYLKKP